MRPLMTHFDRVDTGTGYMKLPNFGTCAVIFQSGVRLLVSAVKGSERVLAPGVDVVLEVVRMAVNEEFPTLIPTLYPGSMATDPKPYASLGATWNAFNYLEHNKTPAVNGENIFSLPVSSTGARSSSLSGPRSTGHGRGQGREPSQSHYRRDRTIIPLFFQSMTPLTHCLTTHPTAGH